MFLSSFEKMRISTLNAYAITNLMHMENMVMGIAFGTAVTVFRNAVIYGYKGTYNHIKYENIVDGILCEFPVKGNRFAQISTENFSKIPGSPVAYWVSHKIVTCFSDNKCINELSYPRQGLATGNNDVFLRLWYEVKNIDVSRHSKNQKEFFASLKKYVPYNKGGTFRKWYANIEWLIRFDKPHFDILKTVGNHLPSKEFYFRDSITWSKVTSGAFSRRYIPVGSVFDVAGCSIFADAKITYILAFANSKVMQYLMDVLSQTLNYEVGNVKNIPLIIGEQEFEVEQLSNKNIELSKCALDSFETSWDFMRHPLV